MVTTFGKAFNILGRKLGGFAENVHERMTAETLGHTVVAVSHKADSCLKQLKTDKPDLMLLDIDLGRGQEDGIFLAKTIKSTYRLPYIFLTSYFDDSTVARASEAQPSAYILKPFQEKDLKVALDMAKYKCSQAKQAVTSKTTQLFVKDTKGVMKPIQLSDILYFSANDNYCYIHTANDKYLVLHKLKDFLQEYSGHGFVQIHRSYVININHIVQLTDLHAYVGAHKIPIGRSFRNDFFHHFKIL